jgi:hypothetical protein
MIESRSSSVYLSPENILKCVSGLDIFKFYNPNIKDTTKNFCSDLREDKTPSCRIQLWGGAYLYKDFTTGEVYTCFSYIEKKFGVDFRTALEIINRDLNLNLDTSLKGNIKIRMSSGYVSPVNAKNRRKVITVEERNWKNIDRELWFKYGITLETLKHFDVYPISRFTVDGITTNCTLISPAYVYKIFKGFKIYRPMEKEKSRKWRSNTKKYEIQGWKQLPQNDDLLILTSSLKDVMVLYEMGYNAIALQSEMEIPNVDMIKALKERFKFIVIFYNNDFDKSENWGQKTALKICEKYGTYNIFIPSVYKSTDPSDLVFNIGFNEAKAIIIYELNRLFSNL